MQQPLPPHRAGLSDSLQPNSWVMAGCVLDMRLCCAVMPVRWQGLHLPCGVLVGGLLCRCLMLPGSPIGPIGPKFTLLAVSLVAFGKAHKLNGVTQNPHDARVSVAYALFSCAIYHFSVCGLLD